MTAADLGLRRFGPGIRGLAVRTPTLPPATTTWVWLLGEGDDGLLVEPASPFEDEQARLAAVLRALAGEEGWQPSEALLTHLHDDHVGGARALRESGVPLVAHPITRIAVGEDGIEVDRVVEEGGVLAAGEEGERRWHVLHTPGHARGHVALLQPATGTVVAGDLVAGEGTVVIDPPEGDLAAYLASLARLIEVGARRLLPAHGPVVEDGPGLLRSYLAHRSEREEQVVAALVSFGGRPASPEDLVPAIYAAVPRFLWPVAARSVLAHLLKLVADGRAERDPEGAFRLVG